MSDLLDTHDTLADKAEHANLLPKPKAEAAERATETELYHQTADLLRDLETKLDRAGDHAMTLHDAKLIGLLGEVERRVLVGLSQLTMIGAPGRFFTGTGEVALLRQKLYEREKELAEYRAVKAAEANPPPPTVPTGSGPRDPMVQAIAEEMGAADQRIQAAFIAFLPQLLYYKQVAENARKLSKFTFPDWADATADNQGHFRNLASAQVMAFRELRPVFMTRRDQFAKQAMGVLAKLQFAATRPDEKGVVCYCCPLCHIFQGEPHEGDCEIGNAIAKAKELGDLMAVE